ncbi:hypothetical protein PR048_003980 [Dryococelus australis]|uniref:Uncharacterized protein n=1 Tax=Dryococelus australis TaxID=614101 RepID=A0ABQ9I472_9NEOP|nr:hypothetical protein PR048_003980 [Dryococelus australis]
MEDEEQQVPGRVFNWDQLKEDWKQALSRGVTTAFAIDNVQQVAAFLLVMMVSLVMGAFHAVRHLGDFTLKLLHEVSYLVHALTPLMLGVLDFLSKCVGGLYLLVAMMFRGHGLPSQPQPPAYKTLPSIKYGRRTAGNW